MGKTFNESVQDFILFMKQHSSLDDFVTVRTDAEEDIQSDIVDQLIDEIQANNLITHDAPVEITLDLDNLREWLRLYYRVETK